MVTEPRLQCAYVVCRECSGTFFAVFDEGVGVVLCEHCKQETPVGLIKGFPGGRCDGCNRTWDDHHFGHCPS